MRHLFFLCAFFAILVQPWSLKAQDKPKDVYPQAFSVTARELVALCESDESACVMWIQGVMAGMELAQIMLLPSEELDRRPDIYCYPEEKDVAHAIREIFLKEMAKKENESMLDRPAILSVSMGLRLFLCR